MINGSTWGDVKELEIWLPFGRLEFDLGHRGEPMAFRTGLFSYKSLADFMQTVIFIASLIANSPF